MKLHTLKSKDGKIVIHGTILHWCTYDEFWFVPVGGNKLESWWCKTDFWKVFENISFGKISIINT